MSRRTKIIIAAVFVVLIGALLFLWFRSRAAVSIPEPVQEPNGGAPSVPELSGAPPTPLSSNNTSVVSGTNESAPRAGVEAFSRSFVERYGSYSNQSDFENIENLYPFMTEKMQGSAEAFVMQERATQKRTQEYTGVTTRVLSTRIVTQSDSRATLTLKTQRTESGAALPAPRVYYQDIELSLVSEGGVWKVDEAKWK